ncbi:MAG: Mur ligase family protein [Chitinivibrionia bacterium]|nr:Mur ligase family protein [Chitinivibrionia bacterium]
MSLFIDEKEINSFHFVGILGIGMSAIAQYLVKDCVISGSDRSVNGNSEDEIILKSQGISLFLQDGSGISPKTQALVVSTAIENDNPDIKKANELNIPILHRSEVLAAIVKKHRTISITGTSGKSSVSAMIFHILDFAGKKPSFIGGANLHSLRGTTVGAYCIRPKTAANGRMQYAPTLGNAFRGDGEFLVIEADESDGTVVRYFPEISVLLNISRDHKEVGEVVDLLKTASAQSKLTIFNKDDEHFTDFNGKTFGFSREADYFPIRYSCAENSSTFTYCDCGKGGFKTHPYGDGASTGEKCFAPTQNTTFVLNFTGEHTIKNALAALAVCKELGIDEKTIAEALATYSGIARRFDKYPASKNILVIDDYAHNPDKISAAISAAKMRKTPLSVVFQPHGFGPLKFMFDDLKTMFSEYIGENDKLYLLPTFYAGGTADTSTDSDKLADELGDKNRFVFVENREKLTEILKKEVKENETILICGARDNSLAVFAKDLAESL